MPWFHLDKNRNEIVDQVIKEIEKEGSDRAVAVVLAAFIDDHLTSFIQTRLLPDEKVVADMFKADAPLGQFGAKIKLGFLMRLYSADAYRELVTIKDIRNAFSHKLEHHSFSEQRMEALCKNLKLWETKKITVKTKIREDQSKKLVVSLGDNLQLGENEIYLIDTKEQYSPKERYMNACKFFIGALAISINEQYVIQTKLPF